MLGSKKRKSINPFFFFYSFFLSNKRDFTTSPSELLKISLLIIKLTREKKWERDFGGKNNLIKINKQKKKKKTPKEAFFPKFIYLFFYLR